MKAAEVHSIEAEHGTPTSVTSVVRHARASASLDALTWPVADSGFGANFSFME